MQELATVIPDAETVLALVPEELGAKLLFLLRYRDRRESIHPHNCMMEILNAPQGDPRAYSPGRRKEVAVAVSEAFAWMEAQGLIVPDPGQMAGSGWKILSRRARQFEDETQFLRFAVARQLPKELLHQAISDRVWMAFMRGEFDTAVFQAMKAVEISVREAAEFPPGEHGVAMIRRAFHPDPGPLRNPSQEPAEREARMHLFSGAVGSYKNPHSHRNVPLEDPAEAIEVILLANHLLRIVDDRRAAATASVE